MISKHIKSLLSGEVGGTPFPVGNIGEVFKVSWRRFSGAFLLLFVFLITSCSDDDDNQTFGDEWRIKNEQKFNEIANNPEYKELKSLGNNGSIYYKVLKKGEGTKPIYYTSSVKTYYKGWYTVTHEYRKAGDVFESVLPENNPASSYVVSTLTNSTNLKPEGWQIALQNMVEGDKWEIWIPARLGYGTRDAYDKYNNLIMEGNTTLAFELEVVSVTQ